MILTIQILKELYQKYNEDYFNNELPPIKFEFANGSKALGVTHSTRTFENNKSLLIPKKITFTKKYQWNEKMLKEILLHEMIHVYEAVKYNETSHGKVFRHVANYIKTRCGVSIERTYKGELQLSEKRKNYVLLNHQTGKFLVLKPKNTEELINHIKNCNSLSGWTRLYKVISDTLLVNYSVSRNYKKFNYYLNKDIVNEIVNNYIRIY